jgi:queuosine precursor transporter
VTNGLILAVGVLLDFMFILVVSRLGKAWLVAAIVLNIILISTFGAKLVTLFGFTTNTGNVFYAAVFFSTQLLVERYGRKEGYKSIWIGATSIIFFILMAQLTILTEGLPQTAGVNQAMETLFEAAPRIALASLLAYIFSQLVNINLYDYLKTKTRGTRPYLRLNISNIAGQLVDSVIFFTIAFYGSLSPVIFFQTLITGFILKVIVGVISTPFLYMSLAPGAKDPDPE